MRVSYKKKLWNFFLASLKSRKKGVGSKVGSGSISQRYLRIRESGIRIRTKMSPIPNTGSNTTLWSYPSPPLDGRDALSRGSRPSAAQSLDQRDAHCNVITEITSESYKLAAPLKLLTNFENPFSNLLQRHLRAILRLKKLTESRLWFCKIIPEATGDKLILVHFSMQPNVRSALENIDQSQRREFWGGFQWNWLVFSKLQ